MRRSAPVRSSALTGRGRDAPPLRGLAVARGMRIGLFGGSFDPPHPGHLHAAKAAMRRLGLHRIWWLVSPQNPLKPRAAGDLARRLDGVDALAAGKGMVVTDLEARIGARISAATIAAVKRRWPGVRFVWIMGADNLKTFHRWARWREIMTALPVAVIARPQDPVRARLAPAARLFARARWSQRSARALSSAPAPVWTYLNEPLHSQSSTRLRGDRT